MPIANKEENPQKLKKNKKLDSIDTHNKLNEHGSNTRPSNSDNHCNNMAESVVDKNTFEEKFDHTEEKIRDMSYIHRDIQMRLLKTKKETLES
jgi:hypothetical protein